MQCAQLSVSALVLHRETCYLSARRLDHFINHQKFIAIHLGNILELLDAPTCTLMANEVHITSPINHV